MLNSEVIVGATVSGKTRMATFVGIITKVKYCPADIVDRFEIKITQSSDSKRVGQLMWLSDYRSWIIQ